MSNKVIATYKKDTLDASPLEMLEDLYEDARTRGNFPDMILVANTLALRWYQLTLVHMVQLETEIRRLQKEQGNG